MTRAPSSILVVEDEALIADDLVQTLQTFGYVVPAVVARGEDAIQAATEHKPSLVLMDIKLAGRMDGIDAARAITSRLQVPIVFLTSHTDSSMLQRASGVQPLGYVTKPFVQRELRIALELALHKHEVAQALRTKERWFQATLGSIADAVVATDERGHVLFLNEAAVQLVGVPESEATGRPASEVVRLLDENGGRLGDPGLTLLSGAEASSTTSTAWLLAAGAARPVLVEHSAARICGDRGETLGAVAVYRDISRRRALEEAVERSARLASLATLSAGISHEINNPLTVVLTSIDLALDQAMRGEVLDVASLRDVQAAALRIAEIVRGMREFVRSSQLRLGPVVLADVVTDAAQTVARIAQDHARVVVVPGDVPLVLADRGRLQQVLVNLLTNAVHAIAPGRADEHRIEVGLSTDARGWAVIAVRDDGHGIPRDLLPRVMDPFVTTKMPGGGTGLGLAVSRTLVTAHGGELSVESEVGRGTTVEVRLPPHRGAAA